ncbi:MAG: serine/threonine-protein kinase, partial [Dehalococcoidia bacterium]|nr:serine/threonine-protein kinase [Dehalococcoidia bacterium]
MRDVPDEIGPYTILERIGRGGMGVVYRAKKNTGEVVALKVMRPDLAQNFAFVRRFQREARIAQELDSPHVVRVLDSGGEDDTRYIAMEYVEGQTLAAMLRESGPLPPEDAEDIAIRVARGLAAAHAKGVTHRDISPQNIMLTADGTVKIADFGIARATGYTTLTATGLFMGKPSYAAPETAAGVADIRSDIYALGVVLFEMLSGRPPFTAPTPIAAMEMHARVPPPRLRDLGVQTPPYLEEILQRCLRKDPAERYQTPDQLVTALETRDPTGTITG